MSLSCNGEENGNPLQCSRLENARDGEAWWAAVDGVAESRTRLKRLSSNNGVIALSAAPTKSLWNLRNPSPLLTHPVEMPLIPAPPPQKLPSQDAPFLISVKIFSANPIPRTYTDHALNQRGILSVTPRDPVSFPHSSSGASLKSGPNGHPQGSSPRSDTRHSIRLPSLWGRLLVL